MDDDDRRPTNWPLALLAVALLVLAGGAFYALHVLRQLPAQVAAQGKGIVREIGELARGFKTGTVSRRFQVYNTRLEGTNYLQVATLQQQQTYEVEDHEAVLWGTVDLPPVVVRATFPVSYTYYVDLQGKWQLELRGRRVVVLAPPLRFNKPAIDVSRLRWQIVRGSILRDEQPVFTRLRHELTGRATMQAHANIPVVRDTARQQVARFVRNWLLQTYADAGEYSVEVYFQDEAPAFATALRQAG